MNTKEDTLQLRRLLEELEPEEAAAFDERLRRDTEFAKRFEALSSRWESLELPPAPQPDPYAATRWLAAGRLQNQTVWIVGSRWASGALLTAGLALGLGLGWTLGVEEPLETSPEALVATSFGEESSTLADSYWSLLTSEVEAQ